MWLLHHCKSGWIYKRYSSKLWFILTNHRKSTLESRIWAFCLSQLSLKQKQKKDLHCEFTRVLPWIPGVTTVSVIDVHSCQLNKLSHHRVRTQKPNTSVETLIKHELNLWKIGSNTMLFHCSLQSSNNILDQINLRYIHGHKTEDIKSVFCVSQQCCKQTKYYFTFSFCLVF